MFLNIKLFKEHRTPAGVPVVFMFDFSTNIKLPSGVSAELKFVILILNR